MHKYLPLHVMELMNLHKSYKQLHGAAMLAYGGNLGETYGCPRLGPDNLIEKMRHEY